MNWRSYRNNTPYVFIWHRKTGKSFCLNRNYKLIQGEIDEAYRIDSLHDFFKENYNGVEYGWLPTNESQIPDWVDKTKPKEYIAYWLKDIYLGLNAK